VGRIASKLQYLFSLEDINSSQIGCLVASGSYRWISLMLLVKCYVQEEYEELASQIMNIVERIVSKTKVRSSQVL